MNPTPFPSPTEPPANPDQLPAGQQAVEYIRGQRQNAAYVFLGLSLVFLAATIYLAVQTFRTPSAGADKPAAVNPLDPEAPPELPKAEVANPKRTSYMVGWIGTLLGFLITAAAGA